MQHPLRSGCPLGTLTCPLFLFLCNFPFPACGCDASQAPFQAVCAQQPSSNSGMGHGLDISLLIGLLFSALDNKGPLITLILLFPVQGDKANIPLLDSQVQKPRSHLGD